MMRIINFLVGFCVGAALGGVAAALLAPRSGGETRQRLTTWAQSVVEDAQQAANAARSDAYVRLAELKEAPPPPPPPPAPVAPGD